MSDERALWIVATSLWMTSTALMLWFLLQR